MFLGTKKTTRKKTEDKENKNDVRDRDTNDVESLLHNLSIEENKNKQPNKKRIKNKTTKGLQTIDKYCTRKIDLWSSNNENEFKLPAVHSTPNNKDILKKNDNKINNHDISFHYNSDENCLPSPLRYKNKNISKNYCKLINDKNSSDSVDITSRWSLSDFVPSETVNTDHKIKTPNEKLFSNNILTKNCNVSMSASFLNISNEDYNDFNMTDIINSFINNDDVNPAINLLLNSE